MKKGWRRNSRGYCGSKTTSHNIKDVLEFTVSSMTRKVHENPDYILAAWPRIVGERLAPSTRAERFEEGVLYVLVNNSTLLSLLTQRDKPALLAMLRKTFPNIFIKGIVFRLG